MTTIKPSMTMTRIQKALNKAGDIKIESGTYKITQTLYLKSESKICCEDGVVFEKKCLPSMFMTAVTDKTTKYRGVKNLVWIGGYFRSAVTGKTQSNIITIFHADGVNISKAFFEGGKAPHCIEINASRNVTIGQCQFENHVPAQAYKEAIQIDFAYYAGLTYADPDVPTYDATHCRNVQIINCNFFKVGHAIGTHTVAHEDKHHAGILVKGCQYVGSKDGVFVKCLNMQDVIIAANTIRNASRAVFINAVKTEYQTNGVKVKVDNPKRCKDVLIQANGFTGCETEVQVV